MITAGVLMLTFNNIAFLEYGYYVNRPLLEKMAEATNALHKFVEGFDAYVPAFDEIITAQTSARVEVKVGDATHAIYLDEGRVYFRNISKTFGRWVKTRSMTLTASIRQQQKANRFCMWFCIMRFIP